MSQVQGCSRGTSAKVAEQPRSRAGAAGLLVFALLVLLLVASPKAGALGLAPAPDLTGASSTLAVDDVTAARIAAQAERAEGARGTSVASRAAALRRQADRARRAHRFTRASTLYGKARTLYLRAGAKTQARTCLTGAQDISFIAMTYPYTKTEMLALLVEHYPDVPAGELRAWLGLKSTESYVYDGVRHYFNQLPENLAFRNTAVFQTQAAMMAGYRQIVSMLRPYLTAGAAAPAWQPYAEPTQYDFTQTLSVPRDELPASGDLRMWFPLAVEGGAQTDVRIDALTPTSYLRYPPSTTQNIGLLYQFVRLQDLPTDLDLSFAVSFKHSAQYFKIDADHVGRYDKDSALYRRYTASRANTRITPSIRRTARRVVGRQTNPYLAARRIWNYVIDNVTYSFMPHFALYPRGKAESVYVHQHKYGDCGAQSMYFAALCRAVGIPARCTGGFQLFTGVPAGHFWAELYLPNYGWIPADPTAAELIDYLPEYSADEKAAFHAFFFGSQDDLRLTVQKDVDLPLIPRARQRVPLPMAIQMPVGLCDTMETIPAMVLLEHWTYR